MQRMPDFIIIGTTKCGTTSLYHYLIQHPRIISACKKELHFFDNAYNYRKGLQWYRSQFPLFQRGRKGAITGEATPNYLTNYAAVKRIARFMPKAKMILLLRNPVDRAYSAYNHFYIRKGYKSRFEKIIQLEMEGKKLPSYSILKAGRYVDHIKVWHRYFPKDQVLILNSEEFFENPQETCNEVFRFLGLPRKKLRNLMVYNKNRYKDPINPETRKILMDYYQPYNEQLFHYLGIQYNWN